ncbi:retropepsin-like aspartic protease [Sphingomonas jatrophae]|uniref:Aspartyl protease n=1 Tax=Sphingomonas jatrophae TaxID=1166337 RepID=A0A1I6LLY8_9SPHN|nr:retropepsin-like aspartic protease [Sphingomonas jatrophae]SFS04451.1 Aspartyl protease [Sphingomonas jatrophae]
MLAALVAALALQAPLPAPPTPTATLPPAQIDDTLEIGGEGVAARSVNTRLTVPVRVNGAGPFRFIVDSGADRSVVGLGIASRLELPPEDSVMLHSVAGATRVSTVRVDSLSLGTTVIEGLTLPVLLDSHIGAAGLIGIDALANQRLLLDFKRQLIQVEDSRRSATMLDGEIVVTARRRRGQLILTEVTVGGRRVSAVIDTGSEVTIGNMALHRHMAQRRRGRPLRPVTLTSVTGASVEADLAILPTIRIGRLELRDLTVAFADLPPFRLFGLADQPALLLGTDVLETFRRVALDFGRRRVRFQLRRE